MLIINDEKQKAVLGSVTYILAFSDPAKSCSL